MAIFLYEAVDKQGINRKGELEASTKQDALESLVHQNLTPLRVQERGKAGEARGLDKNLFESVTMLDKILLTKHLGAIVRAGISLHEALDILIQDTEKPLMRRILVNAKSNLERGQPLSATFEYWNHYFSPVFIGLIRAGEISGDLERTLDRLGDQLIRDNELVRKVKGAMIYPAILLVASILVVLLLLVFVLPRLATVFSQSGVQLPLMTRILLGLSALFTYSPLLTFGGAGFLIIGGFFVVRSTAGKEFLGRVAFKIPLTRNLIKKVVLTRFSRTLGNLLASGLPIIQSLDILKITVGNPVYAQAIQDIQKEVKRGIPLADLLRRDVRLFPHLLSSMVLVGERTGSLEDVLKTVASFYDEEVDRSLKAIVSLIEPAMLLVMGLIIGSIAVSILLPIYQLVGTLG